MRALLLFLFAAAGSCGEGAPAPRETGATMRAVRVTRDLLADPPAFEVVRAHAEGAPQVGILCPALRHGLDGGDMLSYVLPPPGEVRFTVDERGAPATLRMRCGVDITAAKLFGEAAPVGRFRFVVERNGERVHQSETTIRYARGDAGSEWTDVAFEVAPGDRISLRTSAHAPDGSEVEDLPVAYAGFGGLRLETTLELARTASSPEHPNVVLVVMDTLRADRLATYGYARPTSPRLDELAARGTLFENAYATASWTWPSTASILTGLQPEEHGVQDSSSSFLATELVTLAEALQTAGLTTAAWSANPLITRSRNFAQGFERFEDDAEDFRKTGAFFDDVERWIDATAGTRFFLYLHLAEPHRPYEPLAEGRALLAADTPETIVDDAFVVARRLAAGKGWAEDGRSRLDELVAEAERRDVSAIYDACVWSGDHWLGRTLDALARNGLDDETLVAFTSDHGEELFERNYLGHSKSVHQELTRVPLVLAGPGVAGGVRVERPVSNKRLAPLLAALAGAPLDPRFDPGAFLEDGRDVLPVLSSTEKGFWKGHQNTTVRGLVVEGFALHAAPNAGGWGAPAGTGDAHLFDLAADPREIEDVSGERPDEFGRLRAELERRFEDLTLRVHRASTGTGAGTALLLERIGYAGE